MKGFSKDGNLLPPHSEEAERAVLGCILLSPDTGIADLSEHADPVGLFYDSRHRRLAETILDLAGADRPVDVVSIGAHLGPGKGLEEVGGLTYVTGHAEATPAAASLGYYLNILAEHRKRRSLLAACARISEAARDDDIDGAVALAEREIFNVSTGTPEANGTSTKEAVLAFIDRLEAASTNRGKPLGLMTGLVDLDKLMRGMRAGQLIVVGARPSEGKTALACQITERVAIDDGLPVGFWSLEMTREELVGRILTGRARVELANAEEGVLVEAEFKRLTTVAPSVACSNIHIYDRPGLTISTLRTMARRSCRKYGLKLVVVDYIGLVHGTERRKDRRDLELGEVTSQLKELGKELQVPVLALSQLNRDSDKDRAREPRLSDLRDSGSIEQDSDVVILIHPKIEEGKELPDRQQARLLVKKNRNGRTGPVHVIFNRPLMRFESAAREGPQP